MLEPQRWLGPGTVGIPNTGLWDHESSQCCVAAAATGWTASQHSSPAAFWWPTHLPALQSTGKHCTAWASQKQQTEPLLTRMASHHWLVSSALKNFAYHWVLSGTEGNTYLCGPHWLIYLWSHCDPTTSEPKQELLWWVSAWQSSSPFPTLIISACE